MAELELFPSLLPPSREELGGAEVPAFVGLAWALVLVVEAEFVAEAFLDWGPLVDRASLLVLVGACSAPGFRRVRFGACFVSLLPFAGVSVGLAWALVPFASFACLFDRLKSPEERPVADPFVLLVPALFESVVSLEEILSRDAVSACAVLERFTLVAFAEAAPASDLRGPELELFCLPRLCVSVFEADPPFDCPFVGRGSAAVFSARRGLEGVFLAVLLSALRAVVDFSLAAVSVGGGDGFPFAALSPVRDV